jgi:hypothetical protein
VYIGFIIVHGVLIEARKVDHRRSLKLDSYILMNGAVGTRKWKSFPPSSWMLAAP